MNQNKISNRDNTYLETECILCDNFFKEVEFDKYYNVGLCIECGELCKYTVMIRIEEMPKFVSCWNARKQFKKVINQIEKNKNNF